MNTNTKNTIADATDDDGISLPIFFYVLDLVAVIVLGIFLI